MRAPTLLGVTDLALRFAARAPLPRCARAVVIQFGAITLSASPISKLRAADDERRRPSATALLTSRPRHITATRHSYTALIRTTQTFVRFFLTFSVTS
jgi:hypothetical protein